MDPAVPPSVAAMLCHRWAQPDENYSAFEEIFGDRERQRHPSYYFISRGKEVEDTNWDCMSHKEAIALIGDGVFRALGSDCGSHAAINEHASHAFQEFCRDVYGAWSKYQTRLVRIERACPSVPQWDTP